MRKFWVLMALVLVFGALTPAVSADEYGYQRPIWPAAVDAVTAGEDLVDAVGDAAIASYVLAQKTAGRRNFYGYCGLMVSHQLYNLGINKKLVVFDGNNQFDYYYPQEMTTGGYYINAYPAEEYTLEMALNTVSDYGNKDVFNLLIGFQYTNSGAGSIYGHAVVINGIVDGNLYFVESFNSRFGGQGALLTCSIKEFARYYSSWATFEGAIHFGDGDYSNVCPTISTDLMIQARFSTVLRSQPSRLGKKGAEVVRDVSAGEIFRAIALCRDTQGDFYKVLTNEGFAFISVGAVSLLRAGDGQMTLTDLQLPSQAEPGKGFTVSGTVTATYGRVASVELSIRTPDGVPVRKESIEVDDRTGQLDALNETLWTELLEPGVYIAEVYAYCISPVASDTWGQSRYQRSLLHSQYLLVGQQAADLPPLSQETKSVAQALPDGWLRQQGVDYYICGGQYLTGWQTIEGKTYYFSATGALCKGWLTIGGKTWYLLPDGTGAVGQLVLDGKIAMFGSTGRFLGYAKQQAE